MHIEKQIEIGVPWTLYEKLKIEVLRSAQVFYNIDLEWKNS